MANTKISDFSSATTLGGGELIAGVQTGTNVKLTPDQIGTYLVADAINDGVTTKAPSQNAVFDALVLKVATSVLDTDGTLAANSDAKVATQKATKTYADLKLAKASNLSDLANASTARTNLGVAIGSNVEAWDADLDAIAALSPSNDDIIQRKAGAWTNRTVAQYKTDIGTGSSSNLGVAKIYTSLSTNTDGGIDQNTSNKFLVGAIQYQYYNNI